MIKLSIIIPYYKCLDKLLRLYKILRPQITPEVEVIIIDDGCNETVLDTLDCIVIHLPTNSGGASVPRNVGLDTAQGDYIAFIDSDDTVSTFYVSNILKTIEKGYDYFYISWADSKNYVLIKDELILDGMKKVHSCSTNAIKEKRQDIYEGILIKESIIDENIIDFLNIHKIELWNTGGKPKYWTVLFFTSNKNDLPELMSKVIASDPK